ncbi:PucR family transcriptional regulator [Conexibacter arvalis]|uniref:Sugar diacid utilization regulator n=1 Tax=Conexibacter arvalis TaxID=912552 RepID=A0A840ICQ4_9ACTN|nr:helix-turn-helix domain-containing protein [Conexibacter arvalis]MBB4661720.1 sugar diacid utilization regulator [Conexibacter arvalis]
MTPGETTAPDFRALDAITEAIAGGAGLPEIVRAAARALDASLVLIDRTSVVLAVAARSPAEERALLREAEGVERIELRVADAIVGQLRLRARDGRAGPDPAMLRLVTTLIASEVERVRGPERASKEAAAAFVHAVLAREIQDRDDLVARGKELGISLERGGSVIVARAHPRSPTDDDWRSRLLALAERGARSIAPGAIAAPASAGDGDEVVVLVADADGDAGRRVGATVLRELEANLSGFAFAVGRSRVARDPGDLHRAGNEALLAANVVEGDPDESLLAYDETGTYQLLLPHMSDPAELRRFYDETVSRIVAYDEQYETSDLVGTLETFLECDGNVNATAARLITHRHTVRYRFERVREITGLDVGSTDGRERLSFGLKAMRVLGIAAPRGPATERGSEGGRVRREAPDRSSR